MSVGDGFVLQQFQSCSDGAFPDHEGNYGLLQLNILRRGDPRRTTRSTSPYRLPTLILPARADSLTEHLTKAELIVKLSLLEAAKENCAHNPYSMKHREASVMRDYKDMPSSSEARCSHSP